MRRPRLVLLTLGLALALVASCGGSAPAPTQAPAATATTALAPAAITAPTVAPTAAPTQTPAPTTAPTKTSAATTAPTTAASAGSSLILDKMKTIRAFSADFTTDSGGQQSKGKMAFSGKKMRMDVEAMGTTMAIIADEDKKIAYMYNPEQKQALSMSYDDGATGQTPGEMLDWERNMTAPPKLLGEETVDGKACVVYEFTTADVTSKTWIDKAIGFPIKSESTVGGETTSVHFTNIVIGNVDESLLTLPPGTEIHDMSELTGILATPAAGGATPTSVRASSTPTGASLSSLQPTAIAGPVPAEIKNNLSIPSGFALVQDSGQRVENGDTGSFIAMAAWTGSASTQQIADFYTSALAEGWEDQGAVISDANVEMAYDQKDTDPVVRLKVQAEPVGSGGSVILGNPDYDKWLRQTLKAKPGTGGTILTLSISNEDPNANSTPSPSDVLDNFPVPDDFQFVQSAAVSVNGVETATEEWEGKSTVKNVADFYATALPDEGWEDDGTSKTTASLANLNYTKADLTLNVVVTQNGADTTLSITLKGTN